MDRGTKRSDGSRADELGQTGALWGLIAGLEVQSHLLHSDPFDAFMCVDPSDEPFEHQQDVCGVSAEPIGMRTMRWTHEAGQRRLGGWSMGG
jgi:hypothetical protein